MNLTTGQKVMILLAAWFLLGAGGIGGSPPPFKTDKLSVLVVEESADRVKYTSDQLNVIQSTDAKSVKSAVESKGGRFYVLDKDDGSALEKADDWVKEAFPVAKDKPTPWAVGATPKKGFSAAVTAEDEVLKKVGGL